MLGSSLGSILPFLWKAELKIPLKFFNWQVNLELQASYLPEKGNSFTARQGKPNSFLNAHPCLSASAGVSNICTQSCILGFVCDCWLTPDSCTNKSVSLESEDKNIWTWAPSLVAQRLKHLPAMQETQVWSLGWEDALEKETATLSSILAWRIPWTEKPGGLQPMGSQRVRYDWATSLTYLLTLYFRKPTKTVLCVDMYLPSLLFHGVLSPNAAKQLCI